MLGKKQTITHEKFLNVWNRIADIVSRAQYEDAVEKAAEKVRRRVQCKRVAFAWSGGKDSIALEAVCRRAGVTKCVFGMTAGLEYSKFLEWVTDNMPAELTVKRNKWDLNWLARNQQMLFPQNATIAAKWFKGIQHWAQATYYEEQKLQMILLGRRKKDGNFVGKNGIYESKGVVRFSPICDWSHELTLAAMFYEGFSDNLPPFYTWPRGYRCGTHAWAARQWCQGIHDGYREVFSIEPNLIREAAGKLQSAKQFLERL